MGERFEAKTVKFLNSRTSSTWSDCATLPLETADCRQREREGASSGQRWWAMSPNSNIWAVRPVPQACSSAAAVHGRTGGTANQPKRRILLMRRHDFICRRKSESQVQPTPTHPHFVHGQAGPAMARPGRGGACPASQAYPGMETTRTVTLPASSSTLLMHDGVLTWSWTEGCGQHCSFAAPSPQQWAMRAGGEHEKTENLAGPQCHVG